MLIQVSKKRFKAVMGYTDEEIESLKSPEAWVSCPNYDERKLLKEQRTRISAYINKDDNKYYISPHILMIDRKNKDADTRAKA